MIGPTKEWLSVTPLCIPWGMLMTRPLCTTTTMKVCRYLVDTDRVTEIEEGSIEAADMYLFIKKMKTMHVRAQNTVTTTTPEEAKIVCKFTCPHKRYGFQFRTKRDMLIHADKCSWKDEIEVDHILECRGPILSRQYKVRWKGFQPKDNMCQSRTSLHPELVRGFELTINVYDHVW